MATSIIKAGVLFASQIVFVKIGRNTGLVRILLISAGVLAAAHASSAIMTRIVIPRPMPAIVRAVTIAMALVVVWPMMLADQLLALIPLPVPGPAVMSV